MNVLNSEYLKHQMELRKANKHSKMTEQEWALNHQLLQKIKSNPEEGINAQKKISEFIYFGQE